MKRERRITHKDQILERLKKGGVLTSMDGMRMGIVRMTNRINELIKEGYPIKSRWVKSDHAYKEYYIEKSKERRVSKNHIQEELS